MKRKVIREVATPTSEKKILIFKFIYNFKFHVIVNLRISPSIESLQWLLRDNSRETPGFHISL